MAIGLSAVAQIQYCEDAEINMAKSLQNTNKQYISLKLIDGVTIHGDPAFKNKVNEKALADYLDKENFSYFRGVSCNIVDASEFNTIFKNFIVKDTNQIMDFGLRFYDGVFSLSDDGVYVSDYFINAFLERNGYFENYEGIPLSMEEIPGKTFIVEVNEEWRPGQVRIVFKEKILGVFKTDYENLPLDNKKEITASDFMNLGGAIFRTFNSINDLSVTGVRDMPMGSFHDYDTYTLSLATSLSTESKNMRVSEIIDNQYWALTNNGYASIP